MITLNRKPIFKNGTSLNFTSSTTEDIAKVCDAFRAIVRLHGAIFFIASYESQKDGLIHAVIHTSTAIRRTMKGISHGYEVSEGNVLHVGAFLAWMKLILKCEGPVLDIAIEPNGIIVDSSDEPFDPEELRK